jgi:tetratricopeptide (TPR) repeat protein
MTLQEHYNAIKNGKGNKDQFLRQARQLFPQYLNQYSDFNTATNVLKSKQIISENTAGGIVTKGFDMFDWKKILAEETKSVEKETSKEVKDKQAHAYDNADMKNADNINFNEIMKGFYAELKDPKNHDKTGDELKAIVVKNLAKDPLYYTKDGMFGEKGIGYTDEAPGLGKNTQPTSKNASVLGGNDETNSDSDIVKNSLVGSAKKNVKDTLSDSEAKDSMPKKVKEMPDKGVSGVEKKIKLKESIDEIVTGENPYFDTDPSDGDADHDKNMQYGAENYYDKGKKAFDEGDLEKAQEYYEQALEFGSWIGWNERDLPPYSSLEEAMVQGTIVNPKSGGKGEQKIPRAVFLSKEAIDQINDRFPGSIKLISKGKETSMFISQLFAIALGALSRGRYSPDTERKKPELAKFVADVMPSLIRGKIKKAMNPKPTGVGNEQMHYVGLNLVPKKDGSGYWIPLKGEFDPLISEAEQKLRSIISQIIKEELKK